MKRLLTIGAVVTFVFVLSAVAQGAVNVVVDIKPQSCPNPLNVKSKGVLPVAILGTAGLDVEDVNVASIQLEGVPIIPGSNEVNDVAAPVTNPEDCNCTEDGPDDYNDLVFNFDSQAILTALGAAAVNNAELELTLTGKLMDETEIQGQDCVLIIKRGRQD